MLLERIQEEVLRLDEPVYIDFDYVGIEEAEINGELKCLETPETLCVRWEGFTSLSKEAQFLLKTIFEIPTELQDIINGRGRKSLTQIKLKAYLRTLGWSHNTIDMVFGEVKKHMESM